MGSPHSDNKDGDISSDDAFTTQTKIEPPDEHTPRSIYTDLQKPMSSDNSIPIVSNMFQDYQTL